jgi:hypothetical protein
VIRGQDKNVLKKIQYKYALQQTNTNGLVYHNNSASKLFTRNNCPGQSQPTSIIYYVPEGKYSSSVNQAAADLLATNDITANGQNYANLNCNCIYFNSSRSDTIIQNNCQAGYTGHTVIYSVPSGKYSSTISQQDADNQAYNESHTLGQDQANSYTCIVTPPNISLISSNTPPSVGCLITLTNTVTNQYFSFSFSQSGTIGQIPAGTYSVSINANDYSSHTFVINGSSQTGTRVLYSSISLTSNASIFIN